MEPVPDYGAAGDGLQRRVSSPRKSAHKQSPMNTPRTTVATCRLTIFIISVCLNTLGQGYSSGALNGVIVRIKPLMSLTSFQCACLVTMTPLLVMIGCPVAGNLADKLGRRNAVLWTAGTLIVGPLVMLIAQTTSVLFVGRTIVGIGLGMGYVSAGMIITEAAPRGVRAWAVSFIEINLNVGMLLGYMSNYFLLGIPGDWRFVLGIGALGPMLLLIIMACTNYVPESPRWLMQEQRAEEAIAIMVRFMSHDEAHDTAAMWAQTKASFMSWKELLNTENVAVREMLRAGIVVACTNLACGSLFVIYFSSMILKEHMSDDEALLSTLIMGSVRVLVIIIIMRGLDRMGRRPLLLVSTFGLFLSCLWISCSFYLGWGKIAKATGFVLYMASYASGMGPVNCVYCTEIFPTKVRGKGFSLVIIASRTVGVTSTLGMPMLMVRSGVPVTFLLQAFINIILLALVFIYVVETRGRDPEMMEELFRDVPNAQAPDPLDWKSWT